MKTTLLYTIVLLLSLTITISNAQPLCVREIPSFMAAPGGYNISGSAVLEQSDSITLHIDSEFSTQSGPDLHVYLSINFEAPTTPGNTNIDIGSLISNTGAQSYTIPAGVSLGDYNYVLIHCKSFNHWWGGGALGEIDCTTATTTPGDDASASVYPNPAENFVTVSSSSNVTQIVIMDMLGRIRSKNSVSNNDSTNIDVSDLEKGVFFVLGMNERGETIFRKSLVH